ncbi:ABC transporter substrate-binding protein [Hankyongella ginsenosidimutans]|uniref:ABC transporter substrate-binding protein n=1 Tax=Hankyongella ginsenosidimutans TaxID=1763828 RepID=UPI003CCC49FB
MRPPHHRQEKGFFAKYGLPGVEVLKQASWAATRDNLELGSGGGGIDGAHILTPMPYFMTLGTVTKNNVPVPMHILARLNTNGQGISVEKEYLSAKVQLDAGKMRGIIESRKAKGNKIAMAMTFPAAPTISGCATGWPPAASTPIAMSRSSRFRRLRWSPT